MQSFSSLVKLTLVSFLALSVPNLVYAHSHHPCKDVYKEQPVPCYEPNLNDGFYIGAGVGYDSYWVKQNIALPAPGDISGNPRINAPGWVGELFLGYGKYFNQIYYLGAEILGNYSQANESYILQSTTTSYSSKIEARGGYGASILPGLKITDTALAYVRLGYMWNNFRATESASGTSISTSSTQGGFNYGLGIESLFATNWSVRGEYTHTNNGSFSTAYGTSFDPSDNQVMLSVLYHFA